MRSSSYTLVHTGSGLTGFNKGRKNTTTRENFSQLIYYFCALELKFQRRTSNRPSSSSVSILFSFELGSYCFSTLFFQVTVSPLHSSSSHDRHQILGQHSTGTTTVLELLYPNFHRIQSWSSLSLCLPSPRSSPSRVSSLCTLFQKVNSQSHKTDF